MKNKNSCKFCNIVKGEYLYNEIDKPIADNSAFIAIASIGALMEGWTLIMPKKHTLSMKEKYTEPEFTKFLNEILLRISSKYGKVIVFEHGANKEGSITSCGTDHAHLHIVPLQYSLLPQMQNENLLWEDINASQIQSVSNDSEYLFYAELNQNETWDNPRGYIHVLSSPISQYFRKLIANTVGMSEKSDYRNFLFEENALLTKRNLTVSL